MTSLRHDAALRAAPILTRPSLRGQRASSVMLMVLLEILLEIQVLPQYA